jgi:hypothetical protein
VIPSVGRIVHMKLSAQCATEVNRRRADAREKAADVRAGRVTMQHGEQIHIGNEASEGDEYPMLIVRVWASPPDSPATEATTVNGQIFLDGNDVLWATSVAQGDQNGQWQPERVS